MRLIQGFLSLLAVLFLLGTVGAFLVFQHYSQDLPDHKQLADYQPAVATRLYAGDGRLLSEFATEKRVFVPVSAIPKRVIHAFLSAEDKAFYEHHGVNYIAMGRAMLTNVMNLGKRPKGASTITQQVAKNFLLGNEMSVRRKIREAILAYRLEGTFTKDHILELYLNEIYLGNSSYGVAEASLNYFNKSLDDLTIAEAAYLAALPKEPEHLNPVKDHDKAVDRRNYVIGRMEEDGVITAAEAAASKAEPLEIHRHENDDFVNASYFAEEARRELMSRYGNDALYKGGLAVRTTIDPRLQDIATRAMRDGLIAYDRRHGWRGPVAHLASFAEWPKPLKAIAHPAGGEAWQIAAVIELTEGYATIAFEDNTRGHIPMAELRWARPCLAEQTEGAEPRKPGDVLKVGDVVLVEAIKAESKPDAPARDKAKSGKDTPVRETTPAPASGGVALYGLRQIPAIQGGLTAIDPHTGRVLAMVGGFSRTMSEFNRATQAMRQPGSSFKPLVYLTALDNGFTPSSLVLDSPITISQGPGMPSWTPNNYHDDFLGPTPLRVGVEKSRNVMTVRLAQSIGMDKVAATAERFGVVDKMPHELSMALGAGETTTLRMTTAYAMFVNGGKRIVPTLIDRVQDRTGHTIYRHDDRPCTGCLGDWMQVGADVPDVPDAREQIEDPRSAFQIVSILEGVVQRGTGKAISSLGRPLAGKTGTTNDSNDVWFVGFSPDLAVGLYLGFDNPRTLGGHEAGATAAVPVFKQFMGEALAGQPAIPFRVPPGIRLVKVNPANGQLAHPGDRSAIWEAFKPGTEPGAEQPVLEGDLGGIATTAGEGGEADSSGMTTSGVLGDAAAAAVLGTPAPITTSAPPQQAPASTTTGTGGLY